jgi:hypothetical protein
LAVIGGTCFVAGVVVGGSCVRPNCRPVEVEVVNAEESPVHGVQVCTNRRCFETFEAGRVAVGDTVRAHVFVDGDTALKVSAQVGGAVEERAVDCYLVYGGSGRMLVELMGGKAVRREDRTELPSGLGERFCRMPIPP